MITESSFSEQPGARIKFIGTSVQQWTAGARWFFFSAPRVDSFDGRTLHSKLWLLCSCISRGLRLSTWAYTESKSQTVQSTQKRNVLTNHDKFNARVQKFLECIVCLTRVSVFTRNRNAVAIQRCQSPGQICCFHSLVAPKSQVLEVAWP